MAGTLVAASVVSFAASPANVSQQALTIEATVTNRELRGGRLVIEFLVPASGIFSAFDAAIDVTEPGGRQFTASSVTGTLTGLQPGSSGTIEWDFGKDTEVLQLDDLTLRVVLTGTPISSSTGESSGRSKALLWTGLAGAGGVAALLSLRGSSTTVTPPQPVSCSMFTVSPTTLSFNSAGGDQNASLLQGPAGCAGMLNWTTSSSLSWLTIVPASGSGDLFVRVEAATNDSLFDRGGSISIAGISVSVTQTGACEHNLTSEKRPQFAGSGGSGQVTHMVRNGTSCTWTASSTVPWIQLQTTAGSAPIVINYTVQPNTGGGSREGRIQVRWPGPQIGEDTIVTQCGAGVSPPC